MFSSQDFESVGYDSSWSLVRSCADGNSQTTETVYQDGATQCIQRAQAEVQTNSLEHQGVSNVDYKRLATWLTQITPSVLQQLDANERCRSFDGYKLQDDEADSQVKLLHVLTQTQKEDQQMFPVSCVTWSCTGGVIAFGLCAQEHSDWCDHTGSVFLYQINRHDFKSNIPSRHLELSSCVTAMSAHPSEAYILACGMFSGEVVVWNLQHDEAVIVGSSTIHSEPVTHMEWIRNPDVTKLRLLLATAAQDGTVLLWDVKFPSNKLTVSQGFVLHSETADADLGVICASFCAWNSCRFLVGVEGGSILLCSTLSSRIPHRRKMRLSSDVKDIRDPIETTYVGHRGAVTSVKWLREKEDSFVSCGTDAELHIYTLLQPNPLHIIHLLEAALGLAKCPAQSHIFAVLGSAGVVRVYNMHTMKEVPSLRLEDSTDTVLPSSLCFSPTSVRTIATGDVRGKVKVWQAPFDLARLPVTA